MFFKNDFITNATTSISRSSLLVVTCVRLKLLVALEVARGTKREGPYSESRISVADPCPPVSEEIAACAAGRKHNMLRANTSMLRGRLPLEIVRSVAPRYQLRSYQNTWLGPTKSSLDKPNRSLFYVPGSSQKMIDKAWTLKPDNIVLSLCAVCAHVDSRSRRLCLQFREKCRSQIGARCSWLSIAQSAYTRLIYISCPNIRLLKLPYESTMTKTNQFQKILKIYFPSVMRLMRLCFRNIPPRA